MYKFLCALVMYIVIISSIVTYSVYQMESNRIESISLPSAFFTDNINFGEIDSVGSVFDGKITSSSYYTLTNGTLSFNNGLPYRYEDIYLKGVQPNSEGIYEVSYNISNPDNSFFRFWIYDAGIAGVGSIYAEFTDTKLKLREVGGTYILWDSVIEEVPLTNPTSGIITTQYNPTSGYVSIIYDDLIYINKPVNTPNTINYYGGIGVLGETFAVNGIATPIQTQTEETPNIFEIIGSLLLWNVSEDYIPTWLNIILIKVPIIFLALAIAFYIRGVS